MDITDDKNLRCSFCGKTQYEVWRLVAASSANICDQCVEFCHNTILKEELEKETVGTEIR